MSTLCRLLLFASIGVMACGHPPAPAYPDGDAEQGFSEPQEVEQPGMPDDRPPPLRLQPGDTLTIEIVSTETRTLPDVVLDATGAVHVPLAGDVDVGGLGLSKAEDRLQAALRKHDKLVHVNVRMTGRAGQRATVLGAVTTQGSVQLVPGARVTDVIAGAEGLITAPAGPNPVPLADVSGAVVMRDGKRLPINMALALRGDPHHNVYVHPADHIYVPPSLGANITVLGQVGAPQVFPHRAGLRLTEALAIASGVPAAGDRDDIRVIRGTLTEPRVYQASLDNLVSGDAHDVLLRPGDIIFVTDHELEDVGEVLAIVSPALSLGLSSVALAITLQNQ